MSAAGRADVALDVRETSHMSVGMLAYVRALRRWLPVVAPDLRVEEVGAGDNFDLAEQVALPLALARRRPRLAHFPTPYVPRLIPVPYVVTVHDLIDLEFPEYAKPKVMPYWRFVVGPVLRRAHAVITDDDVTVGLLARYVGVDPARVHVVALGVETPDPLPEPASRGRPYLLYAGNHRPHKDLATLIAAWASLSDGAAVDLIVTGTDEGTLRVPDKVPGQMIFAGNRTDEDVWRLVRGALAYVQPSLREGFGLPLLEALRAGTPAIAAETALPTVLRPYVASYPPRNASALGELLRDLMNDPARRAAAVERARVATAHLTWERTARATADVYRSVSFGAVR